MDKQLVFSFLGIYNIWEYKDENPIWKVMWKYKLFGVTIFKRWAWWDYCYKSDKRRFF